MSETGMSIAQMDAMLKGSPFQRLFTLSIDAADPEAGQLDIRLAYSPAVERADGTGQYHGGVIASLIDIAGDFALIQALGFGVPTINFRTDYLRPAAHTDLIARAMVRKAGRTVGVVDIDVVDDAGRLVAIGRGCYATSPG